MDRPVMEIPLCLAVGCAMFPVNIPEVLGLFFYVTGTAEIIELT